MSEEVNTSGWDAIDKELKKIYSDQEPKHYGAIIPYALGGSDPLDGISVYKKDLPSPHWHYVTYGFSELYEKESEDTEESGFGFELTFRLVREKNEEEPPAWALNLLQNMGRYVFGSGNVFRSGDYLDANGSICLNSDTKLTALAFIPDPELTELDTPNGRVEFLQMVGITKDELEAMQTWNTLGMLEASLTYMPYYITDLTRSSLLMNSEILDSVQRGIETEGSNTGFLYVDQLAWEPGKKSWFKKTPGILTLGAKQAEIIGKLLRGRILKGKTLSLSGPEIRVVFEPGERPVWKLEENVVEVILNDKTAYELTQKLLPKEDLFEIPLLSGIAFEIVKTRITDNEGKVVQIIG